METAGDLNAICCGAMCRAIGAGAIQLHPGGPGLPTDERQPFNLCPYCGARYAAVLESAEGWGWRVVRASGTAVVEIAVAVGATAEPAHRPFEYNTPY